MRAEITDYRTAKEKAEGNASVRRALRLAMAIVVVIYLGLAFSLTRVRPGDAEYYISIFTLGLNTLLFAAILAASLVLKKRYEDYARRMRELARADEANPWRVDAR